MRTRFLHLVCGQSPADTGSPNIHTRLQFTLQTRLVRIEKEKMWFVIHGERLDLFTDRASLSGRGIGHDLREDSQLFSIAKHLRNYPRFC
jgi:hypothetical protein